MLGLSITRKSTRENFIEVEDGALIRSQSENHRIFPQSPPGPAGFPSESLGMSRVP
jgi:hypothetical protein